MNWKRSQIDGHRVGSDRYLIPGQGGDVFCALGEDDDQDRSETVAWMKRLLVSDLFDYRVLLFDRHSWCGPATVRGDFEVRGDEPGLDSPSDESHDVFTGGGPGCLPQVDVGLG